jgi:sugar/nucleoside kinase (ribokinase family)
VRALAVVGNLSRDLVDGGPPRAGGAPFWAARALRVLGSRALVVAKCADADRRLLAPPLIALGVPVFWLSGSSTAGFSFRYDGDRREMTVDALGDPWTPEDARRVRAPWVHVGALSRSDFPAETLGAFEGRISLDGQGLVRPARAGPLELDADFDRDVLRHVDVLKLAEEEAQALVDEPSEGALRALEVPEVVVTLGSRGCIVVARRTLVHVPAEPLEIVDPTGAGDAFAAAYMVARSRGHAARAAAVRATRLVARLLARTAR